MKEYVVLTDSDIQDILEGREIEHDFGNGDVRYFISEKHYKEITSISDERWDEAIRYLYTMIMEYASIGPAGSFGLYGVLVPLKNRVESGERTKKLYENIMAVE